MQTPQQDKDQKKKEVSKTPQVHIFAYMRRSTKKEEQAESLLQQEEGIKNIAQKLNINLGDIRFFTESRSGFENRTRKEWSKMIEEIDDL
jgi:hypothetical protein